MEHKTDEDGLPSLQLKLALKPMRPLPVGYSIAFSSLSLKVSCRAFVSVRGIAARLARTVETETATRAGALGGQWPVWLCAALCLPFAWPTKKSRHKSRFVLLPTRAAHVGLFVCLFVGAGPFVSGEHVPFASVQLRLGYSTE